MPDPINDRLTARVEQLQIERLVRVEGIGTTLDATVDAAIDSVLGVLVSRRETNSRRLSIANTLRQIPATLNVVIERQFVRLARWSHGEFVKLFVSAVPRKWFRAINPAAVLVGEDEGGQFFAPGIDVDNRLEPIVAERLSDAEWAAWVAENVFPPPPLETVLEIVHRPMGGLDYKERITALSKLVDPDRVANALVTGYAEGKNVAQLAKDVLPHVEGGIKASARRIARTEGLRIANTMQRESYKDLGDLMIGLQILETLDQNTRPHHALRHGTIYYINGTPPIEEAPDLPDEPNCRGFDVPVLRPPEELANDPVMAPVFQNAAGHAIPDPVTYSQWWQSADVGRQKIAVGTGRYNAMASKLGGTREPEWEDFIDAKGRRLKVAELKGETVEEREARRQEVFAAMAERVRLLQRVQ